MEQFELSEQELEPAIASKCWYCYEGVNAGKLICPCRCTNHAQFIHIDCLEACVNTLKVYRCEYCNVRYPLKLKRKSLLECYRSRNKLPWMHRKVFTLLFHIFVGIIATVFGYYLLRSILYDDESPHPWKFVLLILCLIFNIYSIYVTVSMTTDWERRYCYKRYKSTEELELIGQNRDQETEM